MIQVVQPLASRVPIWLISIVSIAAFGWAVAPGVSSFYVADDYLLLTRSVPDGFGRALTYFVTDWGGSSSGGAYYRPLVNFSLWLNATTTGLAPVALRTTSLGLHVVVAALVGIVSVRRLQGSAFAGALASAVFLLFPLHDQAVLWIAARADVLCAVLYLGAFLGLTSSRSSSQFCGAIAYAFALASKEMAITVPVAVAVWWILMRGGGAETGFRRALGLSALVSIVYVVVRMTVLGGIGGDPAFRALGTSTLNTSATLIGWSVLPFDLDRLRDLARVHRTLIVPLYALALIAVFGLYRCLRRSRAARFALIWVAVALLPVAARANSWYAYIPSIGGAWLITAWLDSAGRARAAASAALVLMMAAGLRAGAEQIADAGRLSQLLVRAPHDARADLLIVNSPIVVRDRYVVVTDQSHFDAAASVLRLAHRAIPLNYAYLEHARDGGITAVRDANGIEARADVTRRRFLTLDGIGLDTRATVRGLSRRGRLATYEITHMERGHIAAVRISALSPLVESLPIVQFQEGRLVPIQPR